jgi:adenylate cyclase
LALACRREGDTYATQTLDEAARLAEVWARKAVEIDSADADALAVLAFSTPYGNREEGYERIARAIRANPNSSRANGVKGAFLLFDGHPLEAREALLTALRLNPRDSNNAILRHQIAISYYFEREYASAAEAARHAIAQHPEFPLTYRWLAAVLGQLNRADEAGDALRRAIEVSPNLDFSNTSGASGLRI